jgi:hypothetical protein
MGFLEHKDGADVRKYLSSQRRSRDGKFSEPLLKGKLSTRDLIHGTSSMRANSSYPSQLDGAGQIHECLG